MGSVVFTQMIFSPTKENKSCSGSLVVQTHDRGERRFPGTKSVTLLRVKSVHVEGCGCYYVYRRPGHKSTSRLITHSMGSVTSDYIGFKIRSIEKVSCQALV